MIFKIVGFVVVALFAVGLLNFGQDLLSGNADPEDAPRYVNEEFGDVGVGVVPDPNYGGHSRDPYGDPPLPVPYRDVPYGADPLGGR